MTAVVAVAVVCFSMMTCEWVSMVVMMTMRLSGHCLDWSEAFFFGCCVVVSFVVVAVVVVVRMSLAFVVVPGAVVLVMTTISRVDVGRRLVAC